jgi:ribonucleoside-diphosphate reductase alpha chain
MELSDTANKIHLMKYALTLPSGKKESWHQTAVRVSEYVSRAEDRDSNRLQYMADFTKIIIERSFIPGGRILANAGTGIKNLFNCFVLPIEDSRASIYKTLSDAAEVFAWGGGIGYNFSNLREEGSPVMTTGGEASGPVSFMELFDTTGEVISQASRRGAQMGILNIDHPDIVKFINYKNITNVKNNRLLNESFRNLEQRNLHLTEEEWKVLEKTFADNQLTHFNISVGVTDDFMQAILSNDNWELVSRFSGEPVNTVIARKLLDEISLNAWYNGDPGLYFIDNANEVSIAPYLGSLDATNPCGEVPLLPYEPCCLGSINLFNFVEDDYIDLKYLEEVVKFAVRFLDNVQTLNETPVYEINEVAKQTRRLGLGVMGFADVLAEMNIPYDSDDARAVAKIFGQTIQRAGWEASIELAVERGAFPAFRKPMINWKLIERLGIEPAPLRNVAVTSIAPTGTIALLADVNSGIEPFFAKKYVRNITHGVGNIAKDSVIQESSNNVKTSHEIHWEDHILMQAEWQNWTDNAVSKTINMDESVTPEEISDAYMLAWESKCKGITIYRNNSKLFQVLNLQE